MEKLQNIRDLNTFFKISSALVYNEFIAKVKYFLKIIFKMYDSVIAANILIILTFTIF